MSLALDAHVTATHELMAIRSHESEAVGKEVEIDTVHHRANVVVVGSEERAVDVLAQHLGIDGQRLGIAANRFLLRIFFRVLGREVVSSVLVLNSHLISLRVDLERERLLRQLLHRVKDRAVGDGEFAFRVALVKRNNGPHKVFTVGGRDFHLAIVDLEEETLKNGKGVLAVDDLRKGLQTAVENRAGKCESHRIFSFVIFYYYLSHKDTYYLLKWSENEKAFSFFHF